MSWHDDYWRPHQLDASLVDDPDPPARWTWRGLVSQVQHAVGVVALVWGGMLCWAYGFSHIAYPALAIAAISVVVAVTTRPH